MKKTSGPGGSPQGGDAYKSPTATLMMLKESIPAMFHSVLPQPQQISPRNVQGQALHLHFYCAYH